MKHGKHNFAVQGPHVWNSLHVELRAPDISLTVFPKQTEYLTVQHLVTASVVLWHHFLVAERLANLCYINVINNNNNKVKMTVLSKCHECCCRGLPGEVWQIHCPSDTDKHVSTHGEIFAVCIFSNTNHSVWVANARSGISSSGGSRVRRQWYADGSHQD